MDGEGVRSRGRRDRRGGVNNKRDKLARRKVEDGDGAYKRKYGESFEESERGSGGKKRRKRVDSGGWDFNARTGERGALDDGEKGRERVSKDKVVTVW